MNKTFYPNTIQPDYSSRPTPLPNSTGCKSNCQAMVGANNLKGLLKNEKGETVYNSDGVAQPSSKIAYWGEKNPDPTGDDPTRYYYNTITTFAGSWNTPSAFTVTKWNIPNNIPNDYIVTNIQVEYAITHVQYKKTVEDGGWVYDREGCKFYASELSSKAANKKAESGGKAKNCQTDYLIVLTGFGKKRAVSGDGLTYDKITKQNLDEYSSMPFYSATLYTGNNKDLNIGLLRNSQLRFILPRNLNNYVGRIVMQYIRLKVDYKPIDPVFAIDTFTVSSDKITTCSESKAKVKLKIKTTNGHTGPVSVNFSGTGISSGIITDSTDTNFKNNIWTVKDFSANGKATLVFYVSYKKPGSYNITAKVHNSSNTIGIKVASCEPSFDFTLLQDNINGDIHTPGNLYSYNQQGNFVFFDYDNKSGFLKLNFSRKDNNNTDNEFITINTDGLPITEWRQDENTSVDIEHTDKYVWTISNVRQQKEIILYGLVNFNFAGIYSVSATYNNLTNTSFTKTKRHQIIIKGSKLSKDYFKIRLEDGSDVRYNSLMFTKGDDLRIPLTYTTEDVYNYTDEMIIVGKKKRIPVNEIQYVDFDIKLNTDEDIELTNVLTYIEAISDGNRCDDVVISGGQNVTLMNNDDEKVCIIHSIKSNETTTIRLAVQSPIEQECFLYIKPYNENTPYTYLENDKIYNLQAENGDFDINVSDFNVGKHNVTIKYLGDKNNNAITKSINVNIPKDTENITIHKSKIGIKNNATGSVEIIVHAKKWIPANIQFKDIPNIKIWIEGIKELDTTTNDKFSLYYYIQNLSNITGKNLRFQIKEPNNFKKIEYSLYEHTEDTENIAEDGTNKNAPWFNEDNRIITFPVLESQNIQQDYRLRVDYQATKKGIYNFTLKTLDDANDLNDDQNENCYTHQLLVDIPSDVHITTSTNKNTAYVDELIDFRIKVNNKFKDQKKFTFNIYDIGQYESNHADNHYEVSYIDCPNGDFVATQNQYHNDNKIGTWTLQNIKANTEYNLTITLKPTSPGTHVIQTIFYDGNENSYATQDYSNKIKILSKKKQLSFNVYQAVSDNDDDCSDCNKLIPICDNDFINLKDNIYYVFEVINNNRNAIEENIHIYARIPESFLENGILCKSRAVNLNEKTNLLNFTIPKLAGCRNTEESRTKFCIKLKPNSIGNFISNFSLATRNANVINKQLKLTVDSEFNQRELEHEVNIYNFDKTNKYYRYEIDNVGEIFKFYNKGDKSVRLIDHEQYNQSAVETYKGTNLRKLVKEIKNNSKYVEPILLKEGENKLKDKGYELYPDGLMRRFGLLKSEVFHYSNQFPITSNLVDKAMKWDIDPWDTKVWAGGIYDNGVFDLTIDYTKIPSNFNILDVNNPINNLQELVDKAKPYGTKAICYYSASAYLKLKMFVDGIQTMTNYYTKISFKIPENKIGVISKISRHDKSLGIYYDMFNLHFDTAIKSIKTKIPKTIKEKNSLSTKIKEIDTTIYADRTNKQYIQDCYDIVSNIYSTKEKNNNIDITKPYNYNDFVKNRTTLGNLSNQQIINFINNLQNNQSIGLKVEEDKTSTIYTYNPESLSVPDKNNILFIFERNDINYFLGFKIIVDGETIESYNITQAINNVSMQVQLCQYDNYKVLHFWGSINNEDYYHIGHLLITGVNQPIVKLINDFDKNVDDYSCNIDNKIVFQLSNNTNVVRKDFDSITSMERKNKWNYLNNINKGNGKYASFKNDIDIDPQCKTDNIETPKLILKYNNIDIDETDEIVDILFKIKAKSNKETFAEDININLYKDGDSYIPNDKIAKKIYYPEQITNAAQEFLATMQLEQPNITMCSNCLTTNLGYYDECPTCQSSNVYHTDEKIAATVCHNCGYIVKGWHDHCTHCLSYDIDNVKIDYNKTYCTKCNTLTDDYYNYCPKCFSSKVIHLSNNKKTYKIFDENTQNIDPINISTVSDKVNVFNIEVPFNNKTSAIDTDNLEYINLVVHGTNHNDGKYYYCESCGTGGIGHYDICPNCNSTLVHNNQINDYVIDIYSQNIDGIKEIGIEPIYSSFSTKVELQDISLSNIYDSFSLLFYIENKNYYNIFEQINQLPIDDESKGDIVDKLMKMNITIDNLSLDYKYKNQQEWNNLDSIYGINHTGVIYNIKYNTDTTNNIRFDKFNIPVDTYKHAYLHLHGIIRNTEDYNINFKISNNGKLYYHTIYGLNNSIFNCQVDLTKIVGETLINTNVIAYFSDASPKSRITILSCDILTEKEQTQNIIHDNINDISTKVIEEHGYYLLTSDNIWGLNDSKPHYLSGRQLKTNLIGYIDFGSLGLEEYIRLYNIEMIVLYKNKMGEVITENIPVKKIANNQSLPNNAIISNDNVYLEQSFNGSIHAINGEIWLSLKYPDEILNISKDSTNNIHPDEELLNAVPLHNKIAQSFTLPSDNINKISIKSYKPKGYPNDIVNVYLCEDDNNKPGAIIRANKIKIDNISQINSVNLDVNDLVQNQTYWFVIKDVNASKYNYHQFEYNNHTEIGQLIRYEDDKMIYDTNCVLSFSINDNINIKDFNKLPTFWSIYNNGTIEYDSYKVFTTFYRYNIKNNSNISISNLHAKHGYKIKETTEDDNED